MAISLLGAGHEVTVYNRTREKAQRFAERGAVVAERLADACRGDATFTMLSDDRAVEEAVFGADGILRHLPRGSVHVSSSTISAALVDRLAKAHEQAGQGFVAAPVLGRPDVAEAGKLFVLAAGARPTLDLVAPLLDAIGQRTFVVSETPEAAAVAKLGANFLIASAIEALGEALALAERSGIDPRSYVDILTSTAFGASAYRTYGQLIADRRFEPPAFTVPMGEKDIGLSLSAAKTRGVPMPLAELLRDRFRSVSDRGGERLDWAVLGFLPAKDAGAPGILAR